VIVISAAPDKRAPSRRSARGVGLAPIKTKTVQIWESSAHEVHAGRSRSERNRSYCLLRAVAYYAQVTDRKNTKRAALPEARKIVRQACHTLTELGDDALTIA